MQQNELQIQNTNSSVSNGKSRRGFASMDKDRHKLVSSKGGQSIRKPSDEIGLQRPPSPMGYQGL